MPEAVDVGFHMDLQTVNGRVRSSIPGLDAEVSGVILAASSGNRPVTNRNSGKWP